MDTFVAEFIKALPDALATAVVTILLAGGILFVFQRKIDDLFAKQMEKFRAKLQYENFEQQQRFSAMYPKRVETLETLYKKYCDFDLMYFNLSDKLELEKRAKGAASAIDPKEADDVEAKLMDFAGYFRDNRIYLDQNSIEQIKRVFSGSLLAAIMIKHLITEPEGETDVSWPFVDKDAFKKEEELLGKTGAALRALRENVGRYDEILEKLYKSAVEAQ